MKRPVSRSLAVAASGLTALLLALSISVAPAEAAGPVTPLVSGSVQVFGTPRPPQQQSFVTTPLQWSVVGTLVPDGSDYNLVLSRKRRLASSHLGAGQVDFIAVNSNKGHASPGSYRTQTSVLVGPGGSYLMEFSNHGELLFATPQGAPQTIFQNQGEFLTVADVQLARGSSYNFFVDFGPCSGAPPCFGAMYVMSSSRSVASESQSLIHCGPVVFSCGFDAFIAPDSGFYGVVFVMVNHTNAPVVTITGP